MRTQLVQFALIVLLPFASVSSWAVAKSDLRRSFPEGERLLYTRLVVAYRHADLPEVMRLRQSLQSHYPASVHLDNAYYLSGILQFQKNHFGEALKSFDVVTEKLTMSNKRPSALFAKAMTYGRLNLNKQAHDLFSTLLKEYPGSPESQRAWMTLELEKEKAKSIKR